MWRIRRAHFLLLLLPTFCGALPRPLLPMLPLPWWHPFLPPIILSLPPPMRITPTFRRAPLMRRQCRRGLCQPTQRQRVAIRTSARRQLEGIRTSVRTQLGAGSEALNRAWGTRIATIRLWIRPNNSRRRRSSSNKSGSLPWPLLLRSRLSPSIRHRRFPTPTASDVSIASRCAARPLPQSLGCRKRKKTRSEWRLSWV